jgi:hypothetical protein
MSAIARQVYCQSRQVRAVSDSQWRRINKLLDLGSCSPGEASAKARVLGQMRLSSPFAPITLKQVEARLRLDSVESLATATGRQLLDQAMQYCKASARTIRRWGDDIGVPLRLSEVYEGDRLRRWAEIMVARSVD